MTLKDTAKDTGMRGARRANGAATRARILDAAEEAFGLAPYDSVTLRQITGAAGVNLALVHYHFENKENLFSAVIIRRADELGDLRLERLRACQAQGVPGIEPVLDAFMRPLFEKTQTGDPGWCNYVRTLGHMVQDQRFSTLLARHFDRTAREFVQAMQRAMPECDPVILAHGFNFVVSLMLRSNTGERRVDALSGGLARGDDLEMVYAVLLPFCAAGMARINQKADPRKG